MRIALIANPSSGSGRGAAFAPLLSEHLTGVGHVPAALDARSAEFPAALRACDAAVVIGGDGSVHRALPALIETRVPFYHVPMGTENLFARHFNMSARVDQIRSAIESGRHHVIDAARCNQRHFAIMLSIGPDAGVMRRMAIRRSGTIRHLSYAMPVLAEAFAPSLKPITAHVDGVPFVTAESGLLVVANSAQYALRFNPAHLARIDDGTLDAIFFPASSTLAVAAGLSLARLRLHVRSGRARTASGTRIDIHAPGLPVQVDGESCEFDASDLHVTANPGALRVLAGPVA